MDELIGRRLEQASNRRASKAEKRGAHRKRRERSALPGMMIHQNGSTHEWIAGQKWDLIITMDARDQRALLDVLRRLRKARQATSGACVK